MKKIVERIENKVIAKYGFENKRTIITFAITDKIRKVVK